MNIIEAIRDPRVFGSLPMFRSGLTSWSAWLCFLKVVYGLALNDEELALFQRCTGRRYPRAGGYQEVLLVCGIQSGKSRVCALIAGYEALKGENGTSALLLAQNHRSALRVLGKYTREPFEVVPSLAAEVTRTTSDVLELRNGVSVACYPSDPTSIRGLRANVVLIDELSFFETSDGRPNDKEMLIAARGRTATTGGKVISLTSPFAAEGAVFDLHAQFFGDESAEVLVWQAPSYVMNPTINAAFIARMRATDPVAFRSEVEAEFRSNVATALFDDARLLACVEKGVLDRTSEIYGPPFGFVDFASGSSNDSASGSVAYCDHEGRAHLVGMLTFDPPFSPESAVAQMAEWFRKLGVTVVHGDRFAKGFVGESFQRHGVSYEYSEQTKSQIAIEANLLVNSGKVTLLDDPRLISELRGWRRKATASGRDSVDHAPGHHDDAATAAMGALVLASSGGGRGIGEGWRWNPAGWFQEDRNGRPLNGIVAPERIGKRWSSDFAAVYAHGCIVRYVPFVERKTPLGVLTTRRAVWG